MAETENAPTADATGNTDLQPNGRTPGGHFSAEYVSNLRAEAKAHRLNAERFEQELANARKELGEKLTAAEKKSADAVAAAQTRAVNADLRIAAKDAAQPMCPTFWRC